MTRSRSIGGCARRQGRRTAIALAALFLAACSSGGAAPKPTGAPAAPRATKAYLQASSPLQTTEPAAPDLSGPLRLETLIPVLLTRSPGLRAAHARVVAATERYPQAISLPPPMVEATYFTRNAMAPGIDLPRYNLMFQQEIPFPTTLLLRGRVAAKEAEAEALRYEAAVRDAVTRLKEVHAERAYLGTAARVERAILDVYRRYAELARAGITQGRTSLPESFRAEALLAQSGYDLQAIEEQRGVEDERMRSLLDLPAGSSLGEPVDAGAILPVVGDTAFFARLAEIHSQELRAAHVETEAAEIGARRARWDLAPTFFLGAGYMKNDDYDMTTRVGEDSTTVTLGLTIPVGNPGRTAAVHEADALACAARASEAQTRLRVRADVSRAAFRLRNAERLATLYGSALVPQAEQALLRSQEMAKEGKESLSSSLELAATWQGLRIAEARAVADHIQAVAALERLLGTSAVAVPVPAAEAKR